MNKYYILITVKGNDKEVECEWKKGFDTCDEAIEKANYLCENLIGTFSISVYHFDSSKGYSIIDYEKEK